MAEFPKSETKQDSDKDELAAWITQKVDAWETWRDNNYGTRWEEYYRIFRGFWTEADKTRGSERSRIIGTELSQAVETQVAEIEDAIFARERWIDIVDDVDDEERRDLDGPLNSLLDDFEIYGVKAAVSEIFINGALYGTGIGKIVIDRVDVPVIGNDPLTGLPAARTEKKYCVKLVSISPRNAVIDPYARNVNDAMGFAHVIKVPMSTVMKRVNEKFYRDIPVQPYSEQVEELDKLAEFTPDSENARACKIVEWHGLVPRSMISKEEKLFDDLDAALVNPDAEKLNTLTAPKDSSEEDMVEAIVTIVNDAYVARAVINPFLMGDRSIIAYQHDTVPDRFWGRGVAEKGYNPQKALDAEIRARIDALGFSTAPMMGIDSAKIPRGEKFGVYPGKNILTLGNPAEALMPLKFPPPDPYTFQQTQELREMIQRGTGSYELPANVDNSRMAATSMSMIVGSMIKRSRRTLQNIERQLLTPLVTKAMWRYMQFDPKRFPMKDYKFKVKSSVGIMAREFEQGQLVSLLSTVPGESPAFWMVLKGVYANSSIDEREAMMDYCDQMMEKAMNPEPPPPDPKVMLDMERLKAEMQQHADKMDVEARKLMHRDMEIRAEAERDKGEGRMQTATAVLQYVKAETEQLRAQSESILNLAKAEGERTKAELEAVRIKLDALSMATKSAPASPAASSEGTGKPAPAGPDPETMDAVEDVMEDSEERQSEKPDLLTPVLEKLAALLEKQTADMAGKDTNTEAEIAAFDTVPKTGGNSQEYSEMINILKGISDKIGAPAPQPETGPIDIERDENGLVKAVAGKPVKRDENGRLAGIE